MTDRLPFALGYNLARLGNAGDLVVFAAAEAERALIAKWAGIVSLEQFEGRIELKKLEPNRFGLNFNLTVEVTQSCVVSLEPVKSRTERDFNRELHFVGNTRHRVPADQTSPDLVLDAVEEGPEEIESLQYDLAAPLLEEFILSLEAYPRNPGVKFSTQVAPWNSPKVPLPSSRT